MKPSAKMMMHGKNETPRLKQRGIFIGIYSGSSQATGNTTLDPEAEKASGSIRLTNFSALRL